MDKEKNIENSPSPLSIEKTEIIIEQMKYGVCRIFNKSKGTGFFAKIPFTNSNKLPVLITNNHVINENDINDNIDITLKLYNDKAPKSIKLDQNRLKYTNEKLDITIIEIKEHDDLGNKYLELDDNMINSNNTKDLINLYSSESIYLINYPGNENVVVSYGKPPRIENSTIKHYCTTEKGSSGSPILLIENQKLIGIHHSASKNFSFNEGTLLIFAINEFKKNKLNEQEKGKEEMNNKKNNYNSYIIGKFIITEAEVKTDIKIINSYEQFFRERNKNNKQNALEYKEQYENEKDIKNCEIMIDEKPIKFSYYYKFNKEGIYTITYIFKKNIEKIDYMFCNCTSLKEIDFTNFYSNQVINIRCIFLKCASLSYINLSKFKTYNIKDMSGMVCKCTSLQELDLSNFITDETTNMSAMFGQCKSLRKINLSNFNFD